MQRAVRTFNYYMSRQYLLFVPSGGLGNRMRAVASAYSLHEQTGVDVRVLWFRDWGLDSPFSEIFQPVDELGFTLRDAKRIEYFIYDRPRKHNLFIPRLPQAFLFGARIDEKQVKPLKYQGFDFAKWLTRDSRSKFMSCYQHFGNYSDSLYKHLFVPCKEVDVMIAANTNRFSAHTMGVHIRRTDNRRSIEQSPLELFYAVIDAEVAAHDDTCIFLATDDEPTKSAMRERYGQRVITAADEACRGSVSGIRGAVADMYSLARCGKIYGSAGSSFSVLASRLGGVPLQIVKKEQP